MALAELLVLNDVTLATIVRGRLEAEGIVTHVFDEGFSGLLGGGYPGLRLMVAEEDRQRARVLLHAIDPGLLP